MRYTPNVKELHLDIKDLNFESSRSEYLCNILYTELNKETLYIKTGMLIELQNILYDL